MMNIKVEEWHIATGAQRSCYFCPIANAITARIPAGLTAVLDEGRIRILREGRPIWGVEMPLAVKEFVSSFDDHGPGAVKPFEFEIDFVAQS